MATIKQFDEQPRRTFRLKLTLEMEPPEAVAIVYELAPGKVTFAASPIPPSFTVSADGLKLSGTETIAASEDEFHHPFGLVHTDGVALVGVKVSVTWPAGSFDARFALVLP